VANSTDRVAVDDVTVVHLYPF